MILRRVIDHFRKQEWTAIFLDFLIVVMGVFVGLQVSNWNAERQRSARSETYRARFIDNLQGDIDLVTIRQRYFTEATEYGVSAMRVLDGAAPANDEARWRFVLAAYQAGQIWPFSPSAQVYEELKSAGELDLVGGAAVRDALANYYDEATGEIGITFGAIDAYRALVRERTPWPIQDYIWNNCHPNEEVNSGRAVPPPDFRFMLDCAPPEDAALVAKTAARFRDDAELADKLRGRLAELRVTLNYIENMLSDAIRIKELLEKEGAAP